MSAGVSGGTLLRGANGFFVPSPNLAGLIPAGTMNGSSKRVHAVTVAARACRHVILQFCDHQYEWRVCNGLVSPFCCGRWQFILARNLGQLPYPFIPTLAFAVPSQVRIARFLRAKLHATDSDVSTPPRM